MSDRIGGYLQELSAALTVGARQRRRILDEARAHLTDAAERLASTGVPHGEAERLAIDDFGAVATIAEAFEPEPTATRLGTAVYLHLALLVGAALVMVGLSGAIGGALGLAFGPEFISGPVPSGIDGARCAELGGSGSDAGSCASAWSWRNLEESVLYRGLPGVLGLAILAIHLGVARQYVPRTSWARRTTRLTALAAVVAFAAAGLTFGYAATVLEPGSVAVGPSQVGAGWGLSFELACGAAFSLSLVAYAASRRGISLSG